MKALNYQLYDNEDDISSIVDSSTLTPDQIAIEDHEDVVDRYTFVPVQSGNLAVLISCNLENERPDKERKCLIRKVFWHGLKTIKSSNYINTFVQESSEDQLVTNASENVASLGELWPEILEQVEAKVPDFRGIYSPTYKRKIIFSEIITFKTSELPRWKPNAIIGKYNIEEDHA